MEEGGLKSSSENMLVGQLRLGLRRGRERWGGRVIRADPPPSLRRLGLTRADPSNPLGQD